MIRTTPRRILQLPIHAKNMLIEGPQMPRLRRISRLLVGIVNHKRIHLRQQARRARHVRPRIPHHTPRLLERRIR